MATSKRVVTNPDGSVTTPVIKEEETVSGMGCGCLILMIGIIVGLVVALALLVKLFVAIAF